MRRLLLAGLLFAGCDVRDRSPVADAAIPEPDARPDAFPRPRNDPGAGPDRQPVEATLVTPAGTLEAKVLYASATWGDCPPHWDLRFEPSETTSLPSVTITIAMPSYQGAEIAGTFPLSAFATAPDLTGYGPQSGTLQATRLDYPSGGAPRLTGKIVIAATGWAIDLDLDVLGVGGACI